MNQFNRLLGIRSSFFLQLVRYVDFFRLIGNAFFEGEDTPNPLEMKMKNNQDWIPDSARIIIFVLIGFDY